MGVEHQVGGGAACLLLIACAAEQIICQHDVYMAASLSFVDAGSNVLHKPAKLGNTSSDCWVCCSALFGF